MKDNFDPNLLSELVDCAHNPPGADPVLAAFYSCLVDMVSNGEPMADILMNIKKRRPDITYKHLVNLIYRAFQAVKFNKNDLSYQTFLDTAGWRKELRKLYSDQKDRAYFEKLLRTKSTTTTIYQRYAGPYAIAAYFWDSKPVLLADLGCGGNYGLRGIEMGAPFKHIDDQTPGKIVQKLVNKKINLKAGLAVDKENPDDPKVSLWRMACSFYPQELPTINSVMKFERKIQQSSRVRFIQADLLSSQRLPAQSCDVVILSMILYQLNLNQQLSLIERSKRLLRRGGMMIVQDFAAKNLVNSHQLDFNESWFGQQFSFRTFVAGKRTNWFFWEIFQWNNGRCLSVRPGEDFTRIFKKQSAKNS